MRPDILSKWRLRASLRIGWLAVTLTFFFSGAAVGQTPEPGDPLGLPPLGRLLDDGPGTSGERDSTYFPELRGESSSVPDIRTPGPDLANFPNSPYTLPQGRAYIELSPVFLSGPSASSPATYNAEFLLRFGLTSRTELRLFGNGPTAQWGRPDATDGFAPLAWDLKVNFWKENSEYFVPAAGLEVALVTPTGTSGLNDGYQPIVNLLFDQTLPGDFLLETNVGFAGEDTANGSSTTGLEPIVQWALQRELFEDFDLFFHGYYNGSAVPRFGDGIVLGGGALWAVNSRLAIFTNYNAGVTRNSPTTIFQLGAAFAF
jgi:hypothetical protein